MKYFQVEREYLRGSVMFGKVYSDGEPIDEFDEREVKEITTGFSVWEYEGDSVGTTIGVEFYPVHTDTSDWTDDSEQVLNKIKEEYSADKGWQNPAW